MDTMAQAIGSFAGMGDGGGKSLLAVVGPLVLGMLGKQQHDAGMDANGLASLLRSQKDQIMAAIPSGLSDQLGAAGLIDKARSGMASAAATGSRIAGVSGATGASQAAMAAGRSQWPYWLAALVIVAGLAIYALQRPTEPTVAQSTNITRPSTGTVWAWRPRI
ncbi:hypothetical protein ACVWZ3_003301 [Bradyrhizobium sp. i1.3.6]